MKTFKPYNYIPDPVLDDQGTLGIDFNNLPQLESQEDTLGTLLTNRNVPNFEKTMDLV